MTTRPERRKANLNYIGKDRRRSGDATPVDDGSLLNPLNPASPISPLHPSSAYDSGIGGTDSGSCGSGGGSD